MQAGADNDRRSVQTEFWRSRDSVEFLRGRYRDFVFAPHAHDRDLLGVVTGGAIEIIYPQRRAVAMPGQVILYNHDQVHWGRAAHDEGWALMSVYLPPEALAETAREIDASPSGSIGFPEIVANDPALARNLLTLLTICDHYTHDELACASLLLEIKIAALTRHAGRSLHLPNIGAETRAVRTARDFLDSHFTQKVSLTELANRCGINRYRLIKAFKAAWGVPPYVYLTTRRVHHALSLLREGGQIADVAFASGFADQSHLTRTFKRSFGVTPGQFRNR